MIFWHAFLLMCGAMLGLAVAVAAAIGIIVVAYLGKEAYDERQRTIWRNEPPTHPTHRTRR